MDNGEVIPGLNEDWSFAGAKMFEWLAGLMTAFLVSNVFDKPAHYMPLLVIIWIGTTLTLTNLRKQFPDEERGLCNMCMVAAGFEPPKIPAPAKLQPLWSGCQLRDMPNCLYKELELDGVVNKPRDY